MNLDSASFDIFVMIQCSLVQPQQLEISAVCEAQCLPNAGQPESPSLMTVEHIHVDVFYLKFKKKKRK